MEKTDVIIVGAGSAGLMAARTLARAGNKVAVLEARSRVGGRIHTIADGSGKYRELGAEFIHGYLPLTMVLINKANIAYYSATGEMWNYREGNFNKNGEMIEHWGDFIEELETMKTDQSINRFLLQKYPGEKYKELRSSVRKYVAGYDTADPDKVSAFALRDEWKNEQEGTDLKIEGGYCRLIDLLAGEYTAIGGEIYLDTVVGTIKWQPGQVEVITDTGVSFKAGRVIIALPLGVLHAKAGDKGTIRFEPAVKEQTEALDNLGFGAIIKILFEFDEPFWKGEDIAELAGGSLSNMGFLLSNEEIPTWWTQLPQESAVLTGWLGGAAAMTQKGKSDQQILAEGINSLANIFQKDPVALRKKLLSYNIINWTADPYTRGSYAYDTLGAPGARALLRTAIEDTIYFAGEYMYEGPAMGTVEAALTSGLEAAERILD